MFRAHNPAVARRDNFFPHIFVFCFFKAISIELVFGADGLFFCMPFQS
jgi:hypothetical protein